MAIINKKTPSLAENATYDVIQSDSDLSYLRQGGEPRVITNFVCATTAGGDATAEIRINGVLASTFEAIKARTDGAKINALDFNEINLPVAPFEQVSVVITQTNSSAQSVDYYLEIEG